MNLKEALAKLESLGDEKRRAFNIKKGAMGNWLFAALMGGGHQMLEAATVRLLNVA